MPMNASMVMIMDDEMSVSTEATSAASEAATASEPNYAGASNNQTTVVNSSQDEICVLEFLSSFPDVS